MTTDVTRLRHRVRFVIDQVASLTGLLTVCERRMRTGLTILMYHRVLPAEQCASYPLMSLAMPVNVFREQMRWLARRCRVLPVREAFEELKSGNGGDRPLVAVTFDDGYADNYELAAPILDEHGIRATYFVTSGFVADAAPLWFDRAAYAWIHLAGNERAIMISRLGLGRSGRPAFSAEPEIDAWMEGLKRVPETDRLRLIADAEAMAAVEFDRSAFRPMTTSQLADLHERGYEIASHTVTHPILPQLDDEQMYEELARSRLFLAECIGQPIIGFCYPNGDFDPRVEAIVEKSGYEYACTTQAGRNLPNVQGTRLARIDITQHRTLNRAGGYDEIGFRAELSCFREWLR